MKIKTGCPIAYLKIFIFENWNHLPLNKVQNTANVLEAFEDLTFWFFFKESCATEGQWLDRSRFVPLSVVPTVFLFLYLLLFVFWYNSCLLSLTYKESSNALRSFNMTCLIDISCSLSYTSTFWKRKMSPKATFHEEGRPAPNVFWDLLGGLSSSSFTFLP